MPAMAARSESPTPTPIPAMAPGPILFLAGAIEAVEELLVGVVDGSAEDGPTVLPMAV